MGANSISAWEKMKAKTVEQHNDRAVKTNLHNAARSLEKEKETPKTYLPTIGERENSVVGQLVTDSRMTQRQESKNDNSLWKQTEKDREAYSQYTDKLMKDLQDQLTKYRADNDTAKIAETQDRLTKLQKETETHWTDRVTNTLSGAWKQSVGAYGSAFAINTEDMLDGGRVNVRGESMDKLSFDKDKALRYTQSVRDKTYAYSQSGAADLEQAKKGLGTPGRLGVDVASGLTQLGIDIGVGAVTHLGAMPALAVRAFGGAADQARAEGANVDQQVMYGLASATVEVLTEKLASANVINTKAFGKGALDDLFDGIVAGLEDAASTANGKMIMNRVGSILVGGMGEGMEEGIAGVVEPFLAKLTYGKDIEMNWKDIGYQVLIGALTGAITGVSGQNTNDYRAKVAAANQNAAVPTVDSPAPVNYDKSTQQTIEKAQTADLGEPVVTKTATVLDTGTTAYLELGMKPKRAEAKAKVVQKLINGEQVSLDGMKSLNLTDTKYRAVFTQLTGVQFPEGMTNHDQLMNVAKTASEVRKAAPVAEAPIVPQAAQEAAIVPQTEAQVSGEAPLLTREEFGQALKQQAEQRKQAVSEEQINGAYDNYVRANEKLTTSKGVFTREQFHSYIGQSEKGKKLTGEQIDSLFDYARQVEQSGGDPMFDVAEPGTEYGGLSRYKSSESYKVNAVLRESKGVVPEERAELVKNIDADLDALPNFEGTVYRNIELDRGDTDAVIEFLKLHKPGRTVTYDAYTSTSKAKDGYVVEGDLVVNMTIKGKSGKDISHLYGLPEEQEVLFGRGAQFTVDDIKYDGKAFTLTMTEVTNGLEQTDPRGEGQVLEGVHRNREEANPNRQSREGRASEPRVRRDDRAGRADAAAEEGLTDLERMQQMPWAEQIKNRANLPEGTALYLRDTPYLLSEIGLGDLPMCMTVDHVEAIMAERDDSDQHTHGVSEGVMQRLPELLSSPVMVLKSNSKYGSIVVVTSEIDPKTKDPFIVAIKPNGKATVGGVDGPANFITSAYFRRNFAVRKDGTEDNKNNLMYWATRGDRRQVLYWNKARTEELFEKANLELPRALLQVPADTILKQFRGYRKDGTPMRLFDMSEEENEYGIRNEESKGSMGPNDSRAESGVRETGQEPAPDQLRGRGARADRQNREQVNTDLEGAVAAEKQAVAPFTYGNWFAVNDELGPFRSELWLKDFDFDVETLELGYRDEDTGVWTTVAEFPHTSTGLKAFNQEAPALIAERKAERYKAVDAVERKVGNMVYTVYRDPSAHGFEKAVNDAKRVGVELLVAAGDRMVRLEDGHWVGGFTLAEDGIIVSGEGPTTADHEVMHGYLATDHDFRNKIVKGMQTKGRKEAFEAAVRGAEKLWGSRYRQLFSKETNDPDMLDCLVDYALVNEVLCEARAGSVKNDLQSIRKLIPYVQRETEKWEAQWDSQEHTGKIRRRTNPDVEELIEMLPSAEGEELEFDDGHLSNYGSYDTSDAYEPADEYDSDGEELSKGQARFFAKSKIRNRAGELLKMFHGTDRYGFTTFDPEVADDGISLFFSDSPTVAASYSGTRAIRSTIRKPATRAEWETMSADELAEAFNESANGTAQLRYHSPAKARALVEQNRAKIKDTILAANIADKTFDILFANESKEQQARYRKVLDNLLKAYKAFSDADSHKAMRRAAELYEGVLFGYEAAVYEWPFASGVFSASLSPHKVGEIMRFIADAEKVMSEGDGSLFRAPDGNRVFTREMMIDSLEKAFYGNAGNYPVYLYAENPLVIEADGANWYDIPLPDDIADEFTEIYGDEDGERCTRNLAEFAKNHGYDALVIYDLEDTGKYALENEEATIVVVFESNQIKDAYNFDPTKDPDMRYNLPENADPMYSKLMQEIIRYKGNKLGAASVVPMLRGKGVKAEEIKWSGIETFLEGKKSVNKDELLTFLRDNALVIETEVLSEARPQKAGDRELILDDDVSEGEFVNMMTGELYLRMEDAFNAACDEAQARGWEVESVFTENIDTGLYAFFGVNPDTGHEEVLFSVEGEYYFEMEEEDDSPDSGYEHTRWQDYKMKGGQNYREYLYKMSNSATSYSNQAMQVHWGKPDVLAHARVQDFEAPGQKILFIEEIQSDWHNEGHKVGYADPEVIKLEDELDDLERKRGSRNGITWEERDRIKELRKKLYPQLTALEEKRDALKETINTDPVLRGIRDEVASGIMVRYQGWGEELTEEQSLINAAQFIVNCGDPLALEERCQVELTYDEFEALCEFYKNLEEISLEHLDLTWKSRERNQRVPEAPFSKTYHEFVLKKLLREAAENGYTHLAWTTGQMQEERWSSEYAEGYRIEYDQDIPKFLNKYGKQWGAKVEKINIGGHSYEWSLIELRQQMQEWEDELEHATNDSQREFVNEQIRYTQSEIDDLQSRHEAWAIPITPAMRDSVLYEGQPMFDLPEEHMEFQSKYDAIHGEGAAAELISAAREAFNQSSRRADQPKAPASQADDNMVGWAIRGKNNGAAALGFDPYTYLLNEYGAIEQTGKNNFRVADVPKRTNPKDKVSKSTTTVMGAKATPKKRLTTIAEAVVDGDMSYKPVTNRIKVNKARAKLRKDGFQASLINWTSDVRAGKVNADMVAMGATLLNNAGNSDTDGKAYVRLMSDYAQLLRNAGQALQAANIFKKMTPEAKLYEVMRTVDKINNEMFPDANVPVEEWMERVGGLLADKLTRLVNGKQKPKVDTVCDTILKDLYQYARKLAEAEAPLGMATERTEMKRLQDMAQNIENYQEAWLAAKQTIQNEFGDDPKITAALEEWLESELSLAKPLTKELTGQTEIVIDDLLAEQYLLAETDEERDFVYKLILQKIADQMPATLGDKFRAWRYTAMLGNLRTGMRNFGGNVLMAPTRMLKETFAGLLESMMANHLEERTTSVKRDAETLKAAKDDFKLVKDIIAGGGKYKEYEANVASEIRDRQRIFKNAILEGYRKGTQWMMEDSPLGDTVFSSFAYRDALARYIAANGTTWSQASEELKDKARAKAVREAAEATYRDNNAISKLVVSLRADNSTTAGKVTNAILEGVLPFRKTPANILVRTVEYSPLGLLSSAFKAAQYAKGGDVTGNDIVNSLAKNLTGASLLAVGYGLGYFGLLQGAGPDDEKEKEMWEMQGHQAYSIEVNGVSYTIDWAAPLSIPLLVGSELQEAMMSEGLTLREGLGMLGSIFDPVLEMSMLQGINDAISDAQTYGDESALVRLVGNALWSYTTQVVPTLSGQIERSSKNLRTSTYTDKNKDIPDAIQRALGRVSAKIPGVDYGQTVYMDAWGRTQANASNATLNVIEQFLSPGYANTIVESDMEKELLRLKEATGDSGVLIASAPKYFNVNKARKDLTAPEYLTYAKTRGQTAYSLLTEMTESAVYNGMPDAQKVYAVEKAYDYANQIAKELVTSTAVAEDDRYKVENWVAEARTNAAEIGLDVSTYLTAYGMTKDCVSLKDKNGDTVDNSLALKKASAVLDIPGLSKEQRVALADALGSNKTVLGWLKNNPNVIKSKLAALEKKYG